MSYWHDRATTALTRSTSALKRQLLTRHQSFTRAIVALLLVTLLIPPASAQQLGTWSYSGGASTVNPAIAASFPGGRSGFASFVDPIKRNFYLFGGLGLPDGDGVPRKFSRPS